MPLENNQAIIDGARALTRKKGLQLAFPYEAACWQPTVPGFGMLTFVRHPYYCQAGVSMVVVSGVMKQERSRLLGQHQPSSQGLMGEQCYTPEADAAREAMRGGHSGP